MSAGSEAEAPSAGETLRQLGRTLRLAAPVAARGLQRTILDDRLSKMQGQYERERAERAIVEGALEAARRDRGRETESAAELA
jgi:hypothetical protein